ncbi:MAG TPA: hypothetical protein VGB18_02580 [Candidatus Thermoplasmatota archaeon]
MDSLFPRDSSPRSKPGLFAILKEKLRGADIVGVGVNIVVGALLIGGVIGAMAVRDSDAAPPADVNAASLVTQGEANGTEPAAPRGDHDEAPSDDEDDPTSNK